MSELFFRELEIPAPSYNLGVGSGPHGRQTGRMLAKIEEVLLAEKPDWVMVYGDTNSTIAGALAAVKLGQRLAHVESGLRSYNRKMPEEHNRVLTDHCADVLFCPTETAISNLRTEGIVERALLVGDTMVDSILLYSDQAKSRSRILKTHELEKGKYLLATVHRAENTDIPSNLRSILEGLLALENPIIFPVHPRTEKAIKMIGDDLDIINCGHIKMIEPVGYLDMISLEENAKMILTDSGGIQKEAYVFGVPCVTLREETEWVETVASGWNRIAGHDRAKIVESVCSPWKEAARHENIYGDGKAAQKIVRTLIKS